MFQACRPMGRLFYWVATVAAISSIAFGGASRKTSSQSGPALTSVVDTVYMADQCLNASTWCKQLPAPATKVSA